MGDISPIFTMSKTAIDLFCGGGGASLGLKAAGYHVVAAFDNDKRAFNSHVENFNSTDHFLGDIRDQSFDPFQGIDHVHASPPCQAFSNLTKSQCKENHQSSRDLFCEVLRAVAETSPKTVSVENVPQYQKSPEHSKLIDGLHRLGYYTFSEMYFSSDYGVPQKRPRLISLAIRKDVLDLYNVSHVFSDLFSGQYFRTDFIKIPGSYPADVLWDLIPTMKIHVLEDWKADRLRKMGIDPQNCPIGLLRNGQARLGDRRLFVPHNEYAPTTSKGHWHHWDLSLGGGEYRQVGVRGLARLQGFPDWYKLPKYKFLGGHIIGNSVTPPLLTNLMEQLTHG